MKTTKSIFSLTLVILMFLISSCVEKPTPEEKIEEKIEEKTNTATFSAGETDAIVGYTDLEKVLTITLAKPADKDETFDLDVVCNIVEGFLCDNIKISKGETVGTGKIRFYKNWYPDDLITDNVTITIRNSNFSVLPAPIQLNVKGTKNSYAKCKYQIPIMFHVLYLDITNKNQYPEIGYLESLTRYTNGYFNNVHHSDIEFVLVENDKNGDPLPEKGVNRVLLTKPIEFDSPETAEIVKREMYDINECINVFLYDFNAPTGYAPLPYVRSAHPLDGIFDGDYYLTNPLPSCYIGISSKYIYSDPTTLAHEIGHFLSLDHVFHFNSSTDHTDYCEDTYEYNRDWLQDTHLDTITNPSDGFKRYDQAKDVWFISDNLMDYWPSHQNRFTPNQIERMHHIIKYGIGVPRIYQDPVPTSSIRPNAVRHPVRIIE